MKINHYLKERHKKLKTLLKKRNINVLLITNPTNVTYLTGVLGLTREREAFIIATPTEATTIVSPLKLEQFTANKVGKIKVLSATAKLSDYLKGILNQSNQRSVFFEAEDLKVAELSRLKTKVKASFKQSNSLIEELRLIKDEWEIESLKKACRVAANVWQKLKPEIRAGRTEVEMSEQLIAFCKQYGANIHPDFPPIVAAGANSAIPHHTTGRTRIKEKDVVLTDFGCTINGYCSDMTRILVIGRTNKQVYNAILAVKEAHKNGVQATANHQSAKAIDKITQEILIKHGLKKHILHTTGHGIGLDVHEPPSLSVHSQEDTSIKDGMVITIEPGVYFKEQFGIRHEDTFLITKTGAENLTGQKN